MPENKNNYTGQGTIDLLKMIIILLVIILVLLGIFSTGATAKTMVPAFILIVILAGGLFAGLIAIIRLLNDIKTQLNQDKI